MRCGGTARRTKGVPNADTRGKRTGEREVKRVSRYCPDGEVYYFDLLSRLVREKEREDVRFERKL